MSASICSCGTRRQFVFSREEALSRRRYISERLNVRELLLCCLQNRGRKGVRGRRDLASAEAEPSAGGGADRPVGRTDCLPAGTSAPQAREKVTPKQEVLLASVEQHVIFRGVYINLPLLCCCFFISFAAESS